MEAGTTIYLESNEVLNGRDVACYVSTSRMFVQLKFYERSLSAQLVPSELSPPLIKDIELVSGIGWKKLRNLL
jgi:hypothetical protein